MVSRSQGSLSYRLKIMNELVNFINQSKTIMILPHRNGYNDTIAACLGLAFVLNKKGHHAIVVTEEAMIDEYSFVSVPLPILQINDVKDLASDLVLTVGISEYGEVGKRGLVFKKALKTAALDYRLRNTLFTQCNVIIDDVSSIGEVIFKVIVSLGQSLDKDAAGCILKSIYCETFGYKEATAKTFKVLCKLKEMDYDYSEIEEIYHGSVPLEYLKLSANLVDGFEFYSQGKVVFLKVSKSDRRSTPLTSMLMDYIVNNAFSTENVKVAVVVFETDFNKVRVRIRYEGQIDLYQIEEMFYDQTFDTQIKNKIINTVINIMELNLK